MHLKPPATTPEFSRTELLAHTWWALRTLECLLSAITHRPSSFPLNDCNVALPTASSQLQLYVKITITTQWALSSLYTVKAATLPWRDIQDRVARLKSELEGLAPQITDSRLMAHFAWLDAMMIVTRPCLGTCEQNVAGHCVQAAQTVAQLLPDQPSRHVFENMPWWCLRHYIKRAMGVLRKVDVPADKLARWLECLEQDDSDLPASAFGQHAMDTGGFGFMDERWAGGNAAAQPQFLNDFHAMDDLLDSNGVISTMVAHSRLEMLPMPLVYGTPYG
jgi:hypothetical protein